jgi:hypothetical protein
MRRPHVALSVTLVASATLLGLAGQAGADDATVTITPTVVIVTDTNGKPIRTETIIPKPPVGPAPATPADESGPKTVTVTVTPGNPGILTLGQNDAGQWIGMLIGAVVGALTTVAVITRRRGGGLDEPTPDEPTPDEPTPDEPTPDEPTPDEPTPDEANPHEPELPTQPTANPAAGEGDPSVPSPQA